MLLKDSVAIVTGSGRGLGRAITLRFAKEGAKLAIVDLDKERGSTVLEEVKGLGGTGTFIATDVSSSRQVSEMVEKVIREFSRIDILVNNAGIHDGKPFWEEPEELWQRMYRVNVIGTVLPSQAVVPHMIKRRKGKIVNVSSKAAVVGEPGHAAYSASKGAVLALTRAMAIELASHQITVNAVCPGPMYTDMLLAAMPKESDREALASVTSLGPLGQPEDLVGIILYLSSEESNWCTGQAISVDGGLSILK